MKYLSLFLSGYFFGGAVDHFILALLRSPNTAYGIKTGVAGNWWLGAFDLVLAAIALFWFVNSLRRRSN